MDIFQVKKIHLHIQTNLHVVFFLCINKKARIQAYPSFTFCAAFHFGIQTKLQIAPFRGTRWVRQWLIRLHETASHISNRPAVEPSWRDTHFRKWRQMKAVSVLVVAWQAAFGSWGRRPTRDEALRSTGRSFQRWTLFSRFVAKTVQAACGSNCLAWRRSHGRRQWQKIAVTWRTCW